MAIMHDNNKSPIFAFNWNIESPPEKLFPFKLSLARSLSLFPSAQSLITVKVAGRT